MKARNTLRLAAIAVAVVSLGGLIGWRDRVHKSEPSPAHFAEVIDVSNSMQHDQSVSAPP